MASLPVGFLDAMVSLTHYSQRPMHQLRVGDSVASGTIPGMSVEVKAIHESRMSKTRLRLSTTLDGMLDICLPSDAQVLARLSWARFMRMLPKAERSEIMKPIRDVVRDATVVVTAPVYEYVAEIQKGDWIGVPFFQPNIPSDAFSVATLCTPDCERRWSTPLERLLKYPSYTNLQRPQLVCGIGVWYRVDAIFQEGIRRGYSVEVDSVGSMIVDRVAVRSEIRVEQQSARN